MSTFLDIAYDILKEKKEGLHSGEITRIAKKYGWLKTAGKTPSATMNSALLVDVNTKKSKSRFVKTGPSRFGLNDKYDAKKYEVKKREMENKISPHISTKQKGDIAEARIAELITLYGESSLSCYRPISDDEGIDLIVKKKGALKTIHIQIKSRYGDGPKNSFSQSMKSETIVNSSSMGVVFCFFDTSIGDLYDYLWFVPAPDIIKKAYQFKLKGVKHYGFVAGRKKGKESNKWDKYMIKKNDLANRIIAQLETEVN